MIVYMGALRVISVASLLQADAPKVNAAGLSAGDPRLWLIALAAMALAPFLLTMITSFVKLVVVGSIIRSAIGTQQVPPTQVITGLALILSIHVMWPVGVEIRSEFQKVQPFTETASGEGEGKGEQLWGLLERIWNASNPPITKFLARHSHPENLVLFQRLQTELRRVQGVDGSAKAADQGQGGAEEDQRQPVSAPSRGNASAVKGAAYDMTVLIPAVVVSELTEAFQIGFLIFVPFLIIDMVVANLLLAMGMMMLQPTTVSLPLKLLLFVLIDGWQMIIRGVILGYT
ncbi:MAG: EscR/YscR/HrcR family type III secretion system export apparatus protein [Phycisphaerae bacterium]